MSFISSHCRQILALSDRYSVKTIGILGRKLFCNVSPSRSAIRTNKSKLHQYGLTSATAFSFVKIAEFIGLKDEENHEMKTLLSKAREFLEEGKENEAEDLYSRALKLASRAQDEDDLFFIKLKLATIAFNSKKYKEAETFFTDVKDYLLKKGTKLDDLQLLYIDLRLAEIYDGLNNYKKAEEFYKSCAVNANLENASIDTADEEFIEFWLLFLTSEGHYHLHKGDYNKAHEYFSTAYDVCLNSKGEMTEQTVTILQQLGSVCYQNGDLENAVTYLKKATELGRHLPGMVELSNTYISLGNIYLKQGLIKDAEVLCTQGYKNAKRHKYEQGIKESNACLKELQEALSSVVD